MGLVHASASSLPVLDALHGAGLERSPRLALWQASERSRALRLSPSRSILVVVPSCSCSLPGGWRARASAGCCRGGGFAHSCRGDFPWLIREDLVFHRFIPMRDGMGLEMWMGNNGDTCAGQRRQAPLHDAASWPITTPANWPTWTTKRTWPTRTFKAIPLVRMDVRPPRRLSVDWLWSFDSRYLAMEPTDPRKHSACRRLDAARVFWTIPGWRKRPFEALRYGGVLFLFPIMYYFAHPEPYHMRPLIR